MKAALRLKRSIRTLLQVVKEIFFSEAGFVGVFCNNKKHENRRLMSAGKRRRRARLRANLELEVGLGIV